MVKKRFFIGFNGILLALFLDICLLISIRTVDHHGHFQSATDKWETLLYVLGIYFSFLLFEKGELIMTLYPNPLGLQDD